MSCYCLMRNSIDKVRDGLTPYQLKFGIDLPGPLIPFGSAVDYKPSSEQDKRRLHEFGANVLAGIFMGYSQQHGGGWNGDLLILDQEDISEADSVRDVYLKRIPASQVNVVLVQGKYRFPFVSGELRQPDVSSFKPSNSLSEDDIVRWADGNLRDSNESKENDDEEFAKECEKIEVENPLEAPEDAWLISDYSVIRIHKIPRVDLFKPDEATFPIPVQYLDVMRRTETDLADEPEAKIEDFWTEAGTRSLSDPWTGRTIFTL